jgi:hypothetical protein
MNTPNRPDVLVGSKLPGHSLWEQLQRRSQPLALEFCAAFFNNEMSYKDAKKWLEGYGIKISVTALQGFYNSMDMRLRYASLQAAQSAETAKAELPQDLEAATKERIAQHKFELAFMNLSEEHRLQLIQIQQNEEGMKGNFELKKAKLDLDRIKVQRVTIGKFLDWYEKKEAQDILSSSNLSHADKIEKLGQTMFGEDWK